MIVHIDHQAQATVLNQIQFNTPLWLVPNFQQDMLPVAIRSDTGEVVDLTQSGWFGKCYGLEDGEMVGFKDEWVFMKTVNEAGKKCFCLYRVT